MFVVELVIRCSSSEGAKLKEELKSVRSECLRGKPWHADL